MIRNIPRIAACPVCFMPVKTLGARFTLWENGEPMFFCNNGCRQRWLEENCSCSQSKGWWGRYLDRMARANQNSFGASGPKCH